MQSRLLLNRFRRLRQILYASMRSPRRIIRGALTYLEMDGKIGALPMDHVFSCFPGTAVCSIQMECLASRTGGITLHELCVVSAIACITRPTCVFEFGTMDGRTTLNLALNTPDETRIYTLDLPDEQRWAYWDHVRDRYRLHRADSPKAAVSAVGEIFRGHPLSRKILQLYGDSASFDFSPFYGKVDLVFIDANHDYPYVRRDTQEALRMLSESGTIIWHDYPTSLGVSACLEETALKIPIFHLSQTTLACYSRRFEPNSRP